MGYKFTPGDRAHYKGGMSVFDIAEVNEVFPYPFTGDEEIRQIIRFRTDSAWHYADDVELAVPPLKKYELVWVVEAESEDEAIRKGRLTYGSAIVAREVK